MRIFMTALAAAGLLAACASSGQMERQRQPAMDRWESLVRWSQYDGLLDMMHPDWLEENPVRSLDLNRLKQFQVTEYRVRRVVAAPDGSSVERLVRIRLYHRHSAYERVIEHREVWRWDEQRQRWFLHSGLPDPRRS